MKAAQSACPTLHGMPTLLLREVAVQLREIALDKTWSE
jgi:hypothetical protein